MAVVPPALPTEIVGNADLLARLERDIRAGRLSHAYILDGPTGSGRHTIARFITAAIACRNRPGQLLAPEQDADQLGFFDLDSTLAPPVAVADKASPAGEIADDLPLPCCDCPACRKVLEGTCPDIYTIGRDGKATIGVDAVRPLHREVLIPPNDLDTKIYIIEDAETMTPQAQNALLLTLEEPPPYVLFLLLCNGADALLETIRSRAPILKTRPIPDPDLAAYLQERRITLSASDLSAVLLQADGCIGRALILADARSLKPILKLRETCDAFLEAAASRREGDMPAVLQRFGSKRDAVADTVAMLTLAVRDLLLLRHAEDVHLKYYTDRAVAGALADRFTTRSLLRLYHGLEKAAAALEGNANVRLTITELFGLYSG